MALEYWMAAEKWYQFWAPVSLGLTMFFVLVMAFALTKRKTTLGKRILKGSGGAVVVLALILVVNNGRYAAYLEPASHVTPVIRTMQYKVFQGYQPLTRSSTNAYARYHDPEGVMATGLYDEEIVREPIRFLGKMQRHYYFAKDGKIFKQYESSVRFDETASQTALVGTLHRLKDAAFETIGFQDTRYVFYDHIVIAEKDQGKEYHPEDEFLVPTVKDVFLEWTFRYY